MTSSKCSRLDGFEQGGAGRSFNDAWKDVMKKYDVPWEIAWPVTSEAFRYPLRPGRGPKTRKGLQAVATKLDLEGVRSIRSDPDLQRLLDNPYICLTKPAVELLKKRFRRRYR